MTKDQVSVLFDQVGAKAECPVCGVNDWYSSGAEGEAAMFLPAMRSDGRQGSIPMITLICRNCAFIRQHSRPALDRREQELSAEKDD